MDKKRLASTALFNVLRTEASTCPAAHALSKTEVAILLRSSPMGTKNSAHLSRLLNVTWLGTMLGSIDAALNTAKAIFKAAVCCSPVPRVREQASIAVLYDASEGQG